MFMKNIIEMESSPNEENSALVKNSVLYQEFLAEREEILKHKWLESEKAGHDIGFEKALLDWIVNHRATWRETRQTLLHQREASHAHESSALAFLVSISVCLSHQLVPLVS